MKNLSFDKALRTYLNSKPEKNSLSWLNVRLIVEDNMDVFNKIVLMCKERYKHMSKVELYYKLLEMIELERTHIISINLTSKSKLDKELWSKSMYYKAMALVLLKIIMAFLKPGSGNLLIYFIIIQWDNN